MTSLLLIGLLLGAAAPAKQTAAAVAPPSGTVPSAAVETSNEPSAPETAVPDRPPPSTYERLQAGEQVETTPDEISWGGQLLKTMLGLGVVVGLIYLLFRFGLARYLGGAGLRGTGRALKVVERTQLDARHALLIVEVEGRRMLLATGEQGVQQLADLTLAGDGAPRTSFAQTLKQTASRQAKPAEVSPKDADANQSR